MVDPVAALASLGDPWMVETATCPVDLPLHGRGVLRIAIQFGRGTVVVETLIGGLRGR